MAKLFNQSTSPCAALPLVQGVITLRQPAVNDRGKCEAPWPDAILAAVAIYFLVVKAACAVDRLPTDCSLPTVFDRHDAGSISIRLAVETFLSSQ